MDSENQIDWEKVEQSLSSPLGRVVFTLDNHEIAVTLERLSPTKNVFAVYIDSVIKGAWTKENFPIISKVWFSYCKRLFSKKYKDKILQRLPKKYYKKYIKDFNLDEKIETIKPYFGSIKTLIHQYKKIDGLKLKSHGE